MILIIDNYDSFTYNLYQIIAEIDSNAHVVRHDKISISEITELSPSAIILSPGPGHPVEAGVCIDLIKRFSGMIPILGVCLGHQAIVHAFGGNIISAGELVHGRASEVFHEGRGLYKEMPQPFMAGRYHSLMAEKSSLPEILSIDAISESGLIMGIKHKDHPTYGVQFHPESILTPQGSRLIKSFLNKTGVASCSNSI
jgi:anthranilate synthase/aminodeoxychorismate synthase-like glutamine amidotransferase